MVTILVELSPHFDESRVFRIASRNALKAELADVTMVKSVAHDAGPRPIVVFLILVGCILLLGMVFAAIKVFLLTPVQLPSEEGSIEVTFCRTGDCEAVLLAELGSAQSVHCAFYELNLDPTIAALAKSNADVAVFSENAAKVSGLAIHSTPSDGLMHDKFCVINSTTVLTGSMNPTQNDAQRNDNNLLVIHSPTLARRYATEFEELDSRDSRTYTKRSTTPLRINLSGTPIEVRFCPQDDCEAAVVRTLRGAQQDIRFMTFSFTADPVGDALLSAAHRGVAVEGVFERRQESEYSEYARLQDAGIASWLDANKATMHHKVFIIDRHIVITGSYNPTSSATTRNDENLLIIDNPQLAQLYLAEYDRVATMARAAAQ